jgi:hypothetical protein
MTDIKPIATRASSSICGIVGSREKSPRPKAQYDLTSSKQVRAWGKSIAS